MIILASFVQENEQNDDPRDHNSNSNSSSNNICVFTGCFGCSMVWCFSSECCGGRFLADGRVWFCKGQKNKAFCKTIVLTSLPSTWTPKQTKTWEVSDVIWKTRKKLTLWHTHCWQWHYNMSFLLVWFLHWSICCRWLYLQSDSQSLLKLQVFLSWCCSFYQGHSIDLF